MIRVTRTHKWASGSVSEKNIRAYPLLSGVLGLFDFTEGDILFAAEMVGASFPVLPSSSSINSSHIREGVGGPLELLRVRSDGHVSSIRMSFTSPTSEPGHFRVITVREYVRIPPP
jgi:hypothetical protein